MNKFERVMDITLNIEKYTDQGKNRSSGRKRNGTVFKTSDGSKGIMCAYLNQNDFWIYWMESNELAHYTHVPANKVCDVKKVTALAPYHEGVERLEVPTEYRGFFLNLAKQKETSVANNVSSATSAANSAANNRGRILYAGKIYNITLPQLGSIKVLGANEDEVWNLLRTQCTIEELDV